MEIFAESDATEEETIEEPAEESIIDITTESETEVVEEVKENDVAPEGASEPAEEEVIIESEVKAGDTSLSAKEEIKKNGGIPLSEGTQMTLEAFFNISNEEVKT